MAHNRHDNQKIALLAGNEDDLIDRHHARRRDDSALAKITETGRLMNVSAGCRRCYRRYREMCHFLADHHYAVYLARS